jgi:hypothetical protein
MRCSGIIAPGSGSGAPGTGQRAESAGVRGKGSFFFGVDVRRAAVVALLLSEEPESGTRDSLASESGLLSRSTGRGA